ncbi:MAG: TIGR02281 family clan AA aspartic protease [Magnetococcales bacterium]|nr:TIGR02281 family clan AA aspartic protease [Magnetococcales bacterium]
MPVAVGANECSGARKTQDTELMGKRIGFWLIFMVLMVVLYTIRSDLERATMRTLAAIMPGMGFAERAGTLSFYRASDGHFHVDAWINGQPVRFLVDTGASDIMLEQNVAKTLGFNQQDLKFSKIYDTANGQVRGAPVLLQRFQVGGLVLENLPASVNGAPMHDSLLGMRFFNKLDGFQVQQEVLTIHWQEPTRQALQKAK